MKKTLSLKKKIIISIISIFLAMIIIFVCVFCFLSFPFADKIDDAYISQNTTLNEIKQNYKEVFFDDFENAATSGRITTQNKVYFTHGKIEASIKFPHTANGLWPAFWLMGQTQFFNMQLWPITGEIDIMESICGKDDDQKIYSTIHYGGTVFSGSLYRQGGEFVLNNDKFYNDYHIFGVVITDRQMLFYVNDVIHTYIDITDSKCDTFRKYDKYILLNLAIGGEWAGSPDETTKFPNIYSIDYLKIYQEDI